MFLRKKAHLSKNPIFFSKKPCFLLLRNNINENLKIWKNNGVHRDSNPSSVGNLTDVPRHICIMQATNGSARFCASWAKSWKGKKFHYWIEYFPFENFFWQKILKVSVSPCMQFPAIIYTMSPEKRRNTIIYEFPRVVGASGIQIFLNRKKIMFLIQIGEESNFVRLKTTLIEFRWFSGIATKWSVSQLWKIASWCEELTTIAFNIR